MVHQVMSADVNTSTYDDIVDDYCPACSPLHTAAKYDSSRVARLLLEKKSDMEAVNKQGYTPLLQAAFYGSKKVLELLIANGASVLAKDNLGKTALHLIAGRNRSKIHDDTALKIIKMLVKSGAKVDVKDQEGKKPIDYAETDSNIFRFLKENQA